MACKGRAYGIGFLESVVVLSEDGNSITVNRGRRGTFPDPLDQCAVGVCDAQELETDLQVVEQHIPHVSRRHSATSNTTLVSARLHLKEPVSDQWRGEWGSESN